MLLVTSGRGGVEATTISGDSDDRDMIGCKALRVERDRREEAMRGGGTCGSNGGFDGWRGRRQRLVRGDDDRAWWSHGRANGRVSTMKC
ncbi:hypothetical protein Syun_031397 [Stephania yunnanensis]|uniref:Uncharacterized protein n=1 Tax=Stephania yunnanensis TaxID=152371 RepID=A0AAP0HCD1_9MAGN